MSRGLTAAMLAAIAAGKVRPVIFYRGVFASGTLRLWSGVGTISWDGQTWTGAGNLMGIQPAAETVDIRAEGWVGTLSGMPPSILELALAQAQLGLEGRVWFGALDAAGAVEADPAQWLVGRLDQPQIVAGGETCTVAIHYESRLAALQRPRLRRWTHADQRNDFPGDKGFEYVADLPDQVLQWGA